MAREQFQTLTEPMYYILIALSEECCGVDIMEKVQKISAGYGTDGGGRTDRKLGAVLAGKSRRR